MDRGFFAAMAGIDDWIVRNQLRSEAPNFGPNAFSDRCRRPTDGKWITHPSSCARTDTRATGPGIDSLPWRKRRPAHHMDVPATQAAACGPPLDTHGEAPEGLATVRISTAGTGSGSPSAPLVARRTLAPKAMGCEPVSRPQAATTSSANQPAPRLDGALSRTRGRSLRD